MTDIRKNKDTASPMQGHYHLIDSGNFLKLEQVGAVRMIRPSPQAVWSPRLSADEWQRWDVRYLRFSGGDGRWEKSPNWQAPKNWRMKLDELIFSLKMTDFGHLGFFAEQAYNWPKIRQLTERCHRKDSEVNILNLFAYTGGSTLAAAQAGAQVVHVDASKTSVAWARELAELNGLGDKPIRWIVDDAVKFVRREERRGRLYQGIILDPPSFGRGFRSEVWKIEENLIPLLASMANILDPDRGFVLLSSHSTGYTPLALENLMASFNVKGTPQLESYEMYVGGNSQTQARLPSGACCLMTYGDLNL